jgi:hypothetical protein
MELGDEPADNLIAASLKGFIGAFVSLAATKGFHKFFLASGDLTWALYAASFAGFFSGFFSSLTDLSCIGAEQRFKSYTAVASVLLILFVTQSLEPPASYLQAVGIVLFSVAAFHASETEIDDLLPV